MTAFNDNTDIPLDERLRGYTDTGPLGYAQIIIHPLSF